MNLNKPWRKSALRVATSEDFVISIFPYSTEFTDFCQAKFVKREESNAVQIGCSFSVRSKFCNFSFSLFRGITVFCPAKFVKRKERQCCALTVFYRFEVTLNLTKLHQGLLFWSGQYTSRKNYNHAKNFQDNFCHILETLNKNYQKKCTSMFIQFRFIVSQTL